MDQVMRPRRGRGALGVASIGRFAALLGGMALLTGLPVAASTASSDACRLAEAVDKAPLVQVPFELVDGRIYVRAHVNACGPFRFAVDTGASGVGRADASLVAALGLAVHGQTTTSDGVQSATVDTTHIDSLALGGLVRTHVEVITRDYGSRTSVQARFAGILGREFFADGLLVIDYPRKRLTFSRAQGISATDTNALPYERAFRVPVTIGDVHTLGHLDTGANVAFVLPQSLYERVGGGPLQAAGEGQLTNGAIRVDKAVVPGPIRIGNVDYANVEVRVSDRFPELLVGAHALQDAVLMIDQRSQRVALCK